MPEPTPLPAPTAAPVATTVPLISPEGTPHDVPLSDAAGLLTSGWRSRTPDDTSRFATEAARELDYGGVGGAVRTAVEGGFRGATLGASDVGARILGVPARDLQGRREQNPTIATVSEIGGGLVPSVVAPGSLLARTPAGAVSTFGRQVARGAEEEAASILTRIGGQTAAAALEGAVQGGGAYLSEVALENKPLAAEGFVGGMGKGALWGAGIGGVLAGAGEGLRAGGGALVRAKSLFPKSEVTRQAAKAIDRDATSALSQAAQTSQQMTGIARKKIAAAQAQNQASQSLQAATQPYGWYWNWSPPASGLAPTPTPTPTPAPAPTRAMFGGQAPRPYGWEYNWSPPGADARMAEAQRLADEAMNQNQVVARAEAAQLEAALAQMERAQADLAQWVRSEADPDLEAALIGLRPIGVQSDVAPRLRVAEFGEVVPPAPTSPELGEFGLQRTAVARRGGARGTPPAGIPELPALPTPDAPPGLPSLPEPALADGTPVIGANLTRETAIGRIPREFQPRPEAPPAPALGDMIGGDVPAPPAAQAAAQSPEGDIVVQRAGRPSAGRFEARMPDGTTREVGRPEALEIIDAAMPPGFEAAVDNLHGFAVRRSLPADYAGVEDGALYVVRPSQIAERGIWGNEINPNNLGSIRAARAGDTKLPPIQIMATPDGRLYLEDGNHRLQFAAQTDAPVVATIKRVDESWKPQEGARDVSDRIRTAGDGSPAPSRLQSGALGRTAGRYRNVVRGEAPDTLPASAATPIPSRAELEGYLNRTGRDWIEETVPAREIAARGYYEPAGGHRDAVRSANAKKAIEEGQREPISLLVSPSGKIMVEGGRHRLQAAIDLERPIKVRWSTGVEPPDDLVLRSQANRLPSLPIEEAAPTETLTGLLRGTKAKLEAGEDFRAIGEPVRAQYAADKAARTAQQADYFRAQARGAGGALPDVQRRDVEQIAGAMSSMPASTIDVPEDVISAALRRRNGKDVDIGPNLVTGAKAIDAFEDASANLAEVLGPDAPPSAAAHARAYRLARARQAETAGAAAARTVDDIDNRLVPALRSDAIPPMMTRRLKSQLSGLGYTTSQIDNMSPAQAWSALRQRLRQSPSDATMVDDEIIAALRAADAMPRPISPRPAGSGARPDATVVEPNLLAATHRAAEADAKAAGKAVDSLVRDQAQADRLAAQYAPESGLPASPPEAGGARGLLSLAADAGTAIEVLGALGVSMPDLSQIPVIGPVLSMYLKARAALGIIGRRGGSIARTGETTIAQRSSETHDRIVKAVGKLFEAGAKATKRVAPVVGVAGALGYKLFPGDGETKSKDTRVLYEARIDELARAQSPGAVERAVADRVRVADPMLQAAVANQARRVSAYLLSKAPRETLAQTMLPGDGKWHPSKTAIEQWSRYVAAVHDPAGVLEDLANGHITSEGAEVLRDVYPGLYDVARRILLEKAPEMQRTLPYPWRAAISIMFQIPVDGTMSPQHLRFLQTPKGQQAPVGAPPGMPPGAPPQPPPMPPPALTGPLQLGQSTLTSLERRAGV